MIVLRAISARSAEALLAGRPPDDVVVAPDHPTEFSAGVARSVGNESALGPFFVHRASDDVVVGEIGAGFVAPGTAEVAPAVHCEPLDVGVAMMVVTPSIGAACSSRTTVGQLDLSRASVCSTDSLSASMRQPRPLDPARWMV